jgi:hypothetical protein
MKKIQYSYCSKLKNANDSIAASIALLHRNNKIIFSYFMRKFERDKSHILL